MNHEYLPIKDQKVRIKDTKTPKPTLEFFSFSLVFCSQFLDEMIGK